MFRFKRFAIDQDLCAMKVGMDGVMLGAWAQGGKRILDIGTGTGLIALMMAQRNLDSLVTAIDIDEGAVRQATKNVENSYFRHQIEVRHEAVQQHEVVLEFGKGGEAEGLAVVHEFGIDFICQEQEIVLEDEFGDSLHVLRRKRGTCRVAREVQENRFRLARNLAL